MKEELKPKVKLLTIRQATQVIEGLTAYRIRKLCKSGELPCFKSGNKYLIQEDVLLDLVGASQKNESKEDM